MHLNRNGNFQDDELLDFFPVCGNTNIVFINFKFTFLL